MFWCKQFVFIHVPRTGGTMLTDAFSHIPHVSKDVHLNKHVPASQARNLVGESIWKSAYIFTVARPNDDIAESWWRHLQREYVTRTNSDYSKVSDEWWNFVSMAGNCNKVDFFRQFPPPTMEQFCDLPLIARLSLQEAYDMLKDAFNYDPGIEIREHTKYS